MTAFVVGQWVRILSVPTNTSYRVGELARVRKVTQRPVRYKLTYQDHMVGDASWCEDELEAVGSDQLPYLMLGQD